MQNFMVVGRIGNELKFANLKSNHKKVSFYLFEDEYYTRQNVNTKESVIFPCEAWGKLAETLVRYCNKGTTVSLTGKFRNSTVTEKGKTVTLILKVTELRILKQPSSKPDVPSTSELFQG